MLPGVLKLNFAKETFEYMYVHTTGSRKMLNNLLLGTYCSYEGKL